MIRSAVSLDDRYRFEGRPFYLNGTQSLVRLVLLEHRRRRTQGIAAAVYVTGYRGSPLGALDQELTRAGKQLDPDIVFQPGVNEDLAATAVWGTQQVGTFGEGRYHGVSGMWYGKGPGVDRTGDVFKHANLAGSARHGGVLVVAGDDHTCKSSTTAHQSEFALVAAMMPVLAPASIAEQIEYGLIGWEMSRMTGLWVGLKVVTEIMDSSEVLSCDPELDLKMDGSPLYDDLSLRWPDTPLAQEERLHRRKIPAALDFARANRLDRRVFGSSDAKIGIVTVGKAHADTMQALADLRLSDERAAALGLSLYKVALPWPLEPSGIREFAKGLDEIIVVEEKRGLVEDQLRQHLYGATGAPVIIGKHDDKGNWLLPSHGDLGTGLIAQAIGERLLRLDANDQVRVSLERLSLATAASGGLPRLAERPPHFCPGCPHNTSTKLPDGSKAFAGIGCHYLVQPMERETQGFTQMGGEGANWVGLAPFTSTEHMFQNLGDGTYFHSGSLAIRAAVAAKVNLTYKILYNHAVAMTGGQAVDGDLTLPRLAAQVASEGVSEVTIVSDDPARYAGEIGSGVSIHHRDDLDRVQRRLRDVKGVTVLIYDQTCATELRRLRKRGRARDPATSVVINDLVCEGCGDCSRASNCLSVVPVDTEYGRKRAVDLSTCNKDLSCLNGFCPSFVTVEGGTIKKRLVVGQDGLTLPAPPVPDLDNPFSIIVTGIGGTGVVTIGALIGMAAHLDGNAVRVMDMTGLAQKGGAVVSHIQVAREPSAIRAAKIGAGRADLMIGCDLVVAASPDNLGRVARTGHVIGNDHETATGSFTRNPDSVLPTKLLTRSVMDAVDPGHAEFCDATDLATRLVGDAVGTNLFLVGYAWQRGLVPVSLAALEEAIRLNGVAVELNRAAFAWGRRAALDLAAVQAATADDEPAHHRHSATLAEFIARRFDFLTAYQDDKYAQRFSALVAKVSERERVIAPERDELTREVAQSLFRLMAYKDEYEVARLYTASGFIQDLKDRFEGGFRLSFHLAPPLLAKRDPATGHPRKIRLGPWVYTMFRVLARLRRLRGTPFDIFGYTAERKMERQLIKDYVDLIESRILPALAPFNYSHAVYVARTPQVIKGFGHVKMSNLARFHASQEDTLAKFLGAHSRTVQEVGSKASPQGVQPVH